MKVSLRYRPFLKWAGNKYRILSHLLPLLPQGHRLVEPFGGSCAVFLNTAYKKNLIAESNADLIHLYHYVQKDGLKFIKASEKYFKSKYNYAEQYYELREIFNNTLNTHLRAKLFLYFNRHGYNGLCRYNLQGKFNVPYGRMLTPYFPAKELLYFHERAQHAIFIHQDFSDTFKQLHKKDVVYCDPPYVPLSKTANFTNYQGKLFDESRQLELIALTQEAIQRGTTILISNHDVPFVHTHYKMGKIISFPVSRSISCNKLQRKKVNEILAIFK